MSFYSDVVSDQLPAAMSAVRHSLYSLSPAKIARTVFPELIAFLRKYWVWAVYFLIIRKLYRILSRTNKRSVNPKKIKRSSASTSNSSNGFTTASEHTLGNVDATFLSDTPETTPSTNQVIVGAGVIIVNRNDRYVEVYERKNVAKVDNVDAEVEALLKEFAARNSK
ncbi:hypothetical protein ABB37_02889 [Leptomonas pyrrhocoris]|uniref:Uncharacterized protein n=1 Tax=Leptomonas pyrrhocoris TaxID=157538 RepID=A0A0N0DXP0_LEPPY|nr:hypothetical protein ABB37_02889 [Leptomonas pyrrhocoris]KPA83205.1 hypothetical protein ABB37_02889 [Leptomonas pyrrhocoris]|eukprot:XP_015661644.1 hypothetical protein ABB37_02889 [Leptomonas pyrrhocoris]